MNIKQLIYPLIPALILSTPAELVSDGDADASGNSFVISAGETRTTPGGFSAVAEPAGPVDPEAAKRAAEEYAQKCILPKY